MYHVAANEHGAHIIRGFRGGVHRNKMWQVPWQGDAKLSRLKPSAAFPVGDSLASVSTNGRYLLTFGTSQVRDVRTGKDFPLRISTSAALNGVVVMNDHGLLVAGEAKDSAHLLVQNLVTGKRLCTTAAQNRLTLAISPGGTRFVSAEPNGTAPKIWDATGTECRREKSKPVTGHKRIDGLALDEKGHELAVSTGGVTRLYDLPPPPE